MAVIRSMSTREADHGRATYLMRTGRLPGGPIAYPSLGALVAKELEAPDAELPSFVSVAPFRFLNAAAYGPGFLGPRYAPLVVGENVGFGPQGGGVGRALRVRDLDLPADVDARRSAARIRLLEEAEEDFLAERSGPATISHRTAYQRAVTLMRSAAAKAFDLDEEPAKVRDGYGRSLFGQGCLLARRLVQRGVPFVEVTLNGWDTHGNNAAQVRNLSQIVDNGWSALMSDLQERGLLSSTLIVWMGEFGRTPRFGRPDGRDHWANSWSTVLAGGGIKGGQVVGKTSPDGMAVTERPVSVVDLLGTIGLALGLDITKKNPSNVGRPILFVDACKPIKEVIA
jgi:uncharacterized protein (DUF1501 family)